MNDQQASVMNEIWGHKLFVTSLPKIAWPIVIACYNEYKSDGGGRNVSEISQLEKCFAMLPADSSKKSFSAERR